MKSLQHWTHQQQGLRPRRLAVVPELLEKQSLWVVGTLVDIKHVFLKTRLPVSL
jgi:hypothetical protein